MRYLCRNIRSWHMKRAMILLLLVVAMLSAATVDVAAQSRRQRVKGASAARWRREKSGDSVLYITLLPVRVGGGIDLREHQRMVPSYW